MGKLATIDSTLPEAVDASFVAARAEMLAFHSPYHFLREVPMERQQTRFGTGAALRYGSIPGQEVLPMAGAAGQWLLQNLPWDTQYFGTPTYRLFTGIFAGGTAAAALQEAAARLRHELARRGPFYAFTLAPAEDIELLQALTSGGWRLVETRLNYYCDPRAATLPPPVAVRLARPDEAAHIGRVSAAARNPYDRFHADPWFGAQRADEFLGRFAEATVDGTYADGVLVPNEHGLPVDSFMAFSDVRADAEAMGMGFTRMVLTAVGPANRGWHYRLVAEAIRRAATLDYAYALMNTQSTNRAVFRTCEKVGLRVGSTSHVLACHAG